MPNIDNRIHYAFDGTKVYVINTVLSKKYSIANGVQDEPMSNQNMNYLEQTPTRTSPLDVINGLLYNFPNSINIKDIQFNSAAMDSFVVLVSSNSTDGFDGDWTNILDHPLPVTGATDWSYGVLEMSCTWLKIEVDWSSSYSPYFYTFRLFGEYQSPRFEFYDSAGTSELSGQYPLTFPNAPNLEDYSHKMEFRVKNLDTADHTYSLTFNLLRSSTDSTLTDHLRMSLDGGITKTTSCQVSALANGGLSEVIEIWIDVTREHNPADLFHYWYVDCMEVA